MYAMALENNLDSSIWMIKTKVGTLPFEIIKQGDKIKVWMTQGGVEINAPLGQKITDEILSALSLKSEDLDVRCPIQIASTGHSKVMIGINSLEKLHSLEPDHTRLKNLSDKINCNGFFVFSLTPEDDEILSHGRMFAPAIGILEDPVTGNANGPLGAYLVYNGIVNTKSDTFSFTGSQGEAIGRKGTIDVEVTIDKGLPVKVRIGGEAVVAFKTSIPL